VKIKFGEGPHGGEVFKGAYSATQHKRYVGKERVETIAVYTAQLVKGAVSIYNSKPC
jgi:hypothetical protein